MKKKTAENLFQIEQAEVFKSWNREITKRNGQSFYFASFMLPKDIQERAYAIYALCRLIDDATDESPISRQAQDDASATLSVTGSKVSSQLIEFLYDQKTLATDHLHVHFKAHRTVQTEDLLRYMPALLAHALKKELSTISQNQALLYLSEMSILLEQLKIEKNHLLALVQGQKDDETFHQPADFKEFYRYCFRVAGVVGLVMARVFGAQENDDTLNAAEHLGIAMQITNILRDVKEDFLEKDRIYLPRDLCQKYGLDLSYELVRFNSSHSVTTQNIKIHGIVGDLATTAIHYYSSAIRGVSGIPSFRARLCVRAMAAIYGAILAQMIQKPDQILQGRTIVSRFKKAFIFVSVLFGTHPLRAAGFLPSSGVSAKLLPPNHRSPCGQILP